jgi:hypothetical protein
MRVLAGQRELMGHSRGPVANMLVFVLFVGLALLLPVTKKPEIAVVLGVGLTAALAILRWPIVGTYTLVILPILFDAFPNAFISTFISEMGVFRNLSYRGLPDFVYVSIFELVAGLTLASALVRRFNDHTKLARGPLYRPLMAFGAMVVMGEVIGLGTGGDFKITLWEIRPLLYIVLLYIVAVNTITEAKHLRVILWVVTLSTFARCFEGIYRYFRMPGDLRFVAPVILEHDDSLFFCVAIGLVVAAAFWRKWLPRKFYFAALGLVPLSLYMMDINGRRAVYLCVFIMLAAFLPLIWNGTRAKKQRRVMLRALLIGAVLGSVYLAVFWDKEGGIAQPAASVRSAFVPNERDYLSNLYRDQENTNLRYTIDFSPVLGIGFGKPFKVIAPMVDLTKDWAFQFYMPHNNMLWLWMRMGILGFVAFWVALGAAVLLVAACLRLGVARLRMLTDQQLQETLALHPLKNRQARAVPSEALGLFLVRCRVPRGSAVEDKLATPDSVRRRAEMRECSEFLVYTMMTLATLIALVGLGVVDQGLMSFRLSAFAGFAMGGLSAAWNMYSVKYRVPAEVKIDELPEQEGIVAPRRRMRQLARA